MKTDDIGTLVRLLSLTLLAWSAVMFPGTSTGAETNDETPDTIDELKRRVTSVLERHSVPGGALALVSEESIVWVGGFGVSNVETAVPVTKDTHFRLGSCTKSFLGLGFLKLVEEGRLDLDTPVRDLVPEIEIDNPWRDTDPVRVIHLLEHTSGFDDSRFRSIIPYFDRKIPLREALASSVESREVRWRPGSRYAYSNPGYALAGYVLEKVTGREYEDYLAEAILRPLGMATSTFRHTDASQRLLSVGYEDDAVPSPYSHIHIRHPAGSLNSSAREMALFVQFLLNGGTTGQRPILSAQSIQRLGTHTTTLAARNGLTMGYGFGVSQYSRGGFRCFGHTGGSPGFISKYAYVPDAGLGCVLLLNKLSIEALDELFELVFDYMVRNAAPPLEPPPFQLSANQLEAFAGYYELRSPRIELLSFLDILLGGITVSVEDGVLHQKEFMSPEREWVPVSANTFRESDEPGASKIFVAAPEGHMVLVDSKTYYRRTGAWKPYIYRSLVFGAVALMLTTLVYPLLWVPVHLWKRLYGKQRGVDYLRMRIVPLLAVVSLIGGVVAVGNQNVVELGEMTLKNIIFFGSTLVFAGLSVLSLTFGVASFRRRVNRAARIYALAVSVACCGMTGYLTYWGLIGLRTWAY